MMPDTDGLRQKTPKQRLLHQVPLLLTGLRAALAPVMVALALWAPWPAAFGVCITLAFVSDVFDGVIARRLNIATPSLRRLDSLADTLFYLAASFAAWWLFPKVIRDHAAALGVLVALELFRYAFDLAKFRREASYHMWSSKVWGIALFVGFFALLAGVMPAGSRSRSAWASAPTSRASRSRSCCRNGAPTCPRSCMPGG